MFKKVLLATSLLSVSIASQAFPPFYLGVDLGYSNANYTSSTLINGFTANKITKSGFAERVFIGYNFNRYFASEISVIYFTKPEYFNISGTGVNSTIKNNLISLIGKFSLPLGYGFSVNAKGGIGYVSRDGINVNGVSALPQGCIVTGVYGAGINYDISERWVADVTWLQAAPNMGSRLPLSNYIGAGVFFKFGI